MGAGRTALDGAGQLRYTNSNEKKGEGAAVLLPVTLKWVLLGVFFGLGALMVVLGVLIWRKLWDNQSVQVPAQCIDVQNYTQTMGMGYDKKHFYHVKKPVYRYYYQGQQYVSSPLLASNRPGYNPTPGPCVIRIDPKNPGKVYSPERKFAAIIVIAVGAVWILVALLGLALLPV